MMKEGKSKVIASGSTDNVVPSPGTPGEGKGEGLSSPGKEKSPHPIPLPGYREREQEIKGSRPEKILPRRKIALITGGSRGIGLGIAESLATEGYDLAINGRRPQSETQAALDRLAALGAAMLYLQADVAELAEHAGMIEAIRARFGRLDLLVNNAGIAPPVRADLLEASVESYDKLLGVNLRGPYFLTQAVARWMVAQHKADADYRGVIINISSISATAVSVNRGDYCISKAGIAMATQLWAARLAEFNIDVYEVRPGVIATDMTAGVKEKYDKLIAGGLTVQNRWGTPEDVGKAVAALARGDIPYATGQVLNIDGGMTIQRL